MILAGDIGGTHTRLAFFDKRKLVAERKVPSKNYKGLVEIVEEFAKKEQKKVEKACFGIAGPVQKGRCQATNLPWIVDKEEIRQATHIEKVALINDLEANAHGLKVLQEGEFFVLNKGEFHEGNQALIAAGTGLGEAGLYWDGQKHHPFACEGGHADFAPRDEAEVELFFFLRKKFGHVSYERVLSGPGLYEIYRFLTVTNKEKASLEVEEEMKEKDPASVVSKWGKEGKDRACLRAVDWFVSIYGAEAGNLALKTLALGGLFIGGGIAPILLEKMKGGAFIASFCAKGRFSKLLQSIPIKVILNDNAALLGAMWYAEHL